MFTGIYLTVVFGSGRLLSLHCVSTWQLDHSFWPHVNFHSLSWFNSLSYMGKLCEMVSLLDKYCDFWWWKFEYKFWRLMMENLLDNQQIIVFLSSCDFDHQILGMRILFVRAIYFYFKLWKFKIFWNSVINLSKTNIE